MSVALVTGAARGIGRAIALELFAAGFSVALADREPISPLEGDPHRWMVLPLDIADLDAHGDAIAAVEAKLGTIDCLVNNAGVTSLVRGDMLDLTPEGFDRSLSINLRGTFFLTQAVARRMVKNAQNDPNKSGTWRSIITISSANAEIVGENRADYCMSKAALSMMNKLFASRLGPSGIGVYEIRPGIIHTDMTKPASAKYDALVAAGGVPMGRWGEPEDIAQSVVALAGGSFRYATGIALDIGGGMQLYRI
ncbi:MAG: 3-ketoacyl-ACP reductase [Methylocystaceae bacterium]|nr:3-ketoacyl-ACP reductase [Methylocystaceae bacterium]